MKSRGHRLNLWRHRRQEADLTSRMAVHAPHDFMSRYSVDSNYWRCRHLLRFCRRWPCAPNQHPASNLRYSNHKSNDEPGLRGSSLFHCRPTGQLSSPSTTAAILQSEMIIVAFIRATPAKSDEGRIAGRRRDKILIRRSGKPSGRPCTDHGAKPNIAA